MPQRPRNHAVAVAIPKPRTAPGSLVILAALVALAVALASLAPRAHAFSLFGGPKEVKAKNGVVQLALADVSDGKAHFYSYKTGGKDVQFFVIKSKDGQIRSALNACDVCYREKKGYTQDGDFMICTNCGQRFHSNKIMEVKGGCNPSPLPRTLDAKTVTIREADLKAGVSYF